MNNVTTKKKRVNKKSPEIERFLLFIEALGLKVVDIANKTNFSERTINNFIWLDTPLSGQLLRELHSNFNVSLDWLLTGSGTMFLGNGVSDLTASYVVASENEREKRICRFIKEFMAAASGDEQVWLEMQLKMHVPQYSRFLDRQHE